MEVNTTDPAHASLGEPNMAVVEQSLSRHARDVIELLAYSFLGMPINLAGTVANILNLIIFIKMGFSETINISFAALAVSDLCGLLLFQWVNLCMNPLFSAADLPFVAAEIQIMTGSYPRVAFSKISSFITAYITFERCLCVTMPLKVKTVFTTTTTLVVLALIYLANAATVVPFFVANKLGWKFFPSRNLSLISRVFSKNRVSVQRIAYIFGSGASFSSFVLVMIFTAILIWALKKTSKWREGVSQDAKNMAKSVAKERKLVAMVTMISAVFIVCFLPINLIMILSMIIPGFKPRERHGNLAKSLAAISFLLEELNAGLNIFVFLKMSSQYRATFKAIFSRKRKHK